MPPAGAPAATRSSASAREPAGSPIGSPPGSGPRVRLGATVTAVRQGNGWAEAETAAGDTVRAGRLVIAMPLHAHAAVQGLRPVPADAAYGVAVKSLIELATDLPDTAPSSAVTDSVLGYAYRRDARTLGIAGRAPARRCGWRACRPPAVGELDETVRAMFGAPWRGSPGSSTRAATSSSLRAS